MFTQYEQALQEVKAVMEVKKIARMPRTIESELDKVRNAQAFSTDYAQERVFKARTKITELLGQLSAREFNSLPVSRLEEPLTEEQMVRRVLIHSTLVRDLSELTKVYNERKAELESRILGSEKKVPHIQSEQFRKMLVELQTGNFPSTDETSE